MIEYKGKKIMIQSGYFQVGSYGKYKVRGEILHHPDSFVYGNDEISVLNKLKKYIKAEAEQ